MADYSVSLRCYGGVVRALPVAYLLYCMLVSYQILYFALISLICSCVTVTE